MIHDERGDVNRMLTLVAGVALLTASVACASGGSDGMSSSDGAAAVTANSLAPPSSNEAAPVPVTTSERVPTTSQPAGVAAPERFDVATIDGELVDDVRLRRIPYRAYAPVGVDGPIPVILVSHGGMGSERGYTTAPHIGTMLASDGMLAVHIGHLESTPGARATDDRPADVTAVLDALEAGAIALPGGFVGEADLERVGHTGHSFGAYTAHAVGGADYGRTYRDDRIDAIAPISPQGADQFGAFDRGPDDNTWVVVDIPAYNLIGSAEMNTNAIDTIDRPGWRRLPFDRYAASGDKFLSVIDGQEHSDMWRTGQGDVPVFIAEEIARFFDVYVAGDASADACAIGVRPDLEVAVTLERIAASAGSLLGDCAPV